MLVTSQCSMEDIKRKVSFDNRVVVHKTSPRSSLTDEEAKAVWYSRRELGTIKQGLKTFVRTSMGDSCWRGLEGRTAEGARKKEGFRVSAQAAVFFLQATQEDDGEWDPLAIANAYTEKARFAQVDAMRLAQEDEADAKEIYSTSKVEHHSTKGVLAEKKIVGSAAA
eukprot:Nitzschia sp. Nitz4//scaffold173_size47512//24466//24966//NITZ4_007159-RA/size47512-processed-gene-0.26-mRNA-1//1//CDS//3329538805//7067//frame0